MPMINLSEHPVRSIEDAKAVAFVLGRELKVAGLPRNHTKLLEAVAKLCGAHHFNELQRRLSGAVPAPKPGTALARPGGESHTDEGRACIRITELEEQLNNARSVIATLYHALNDASSVVDAGDDEDYAYQAELESGASFLGLRRT